jgi:rSAM/selenodomain-associated transferase 1
MIRRNHLIVFAKEPRIGRVKRRLAAEIGSVAATFWYRRQLANLLRRLNGAEPWHRHLFVTPGTARAKPIWPQGWTHHAQGSGDLGARMRHALAAPSSGPVVLIGSDIPDIKPHHIRAAFRALARADMVFGPAHDGGYWLIGMRRRRKPPPFGPVRWSGPHAMADTVEGFGRHNKVLLLETLADVDVVGDLTVARFRTPDQRLHAHADEA